MIADNRGHMFVTKISDLLVVKYSIIKRFYANVRTRKHLVKIMASFNTERKVCNDFNHTQHDDDHLNNDLS